MLQRLRHRLVSAWLDVSRIPADVATKLLPGRADGPRARAELFVDGLDAAARITLGGLLRDDVLHADGRLRQVAARHRGEALRLRLDPDAEEVVAHHRARHEHAAASEKRSKARAETAQTRDVEAAKQTAAAG